MTPSTTANLFHDDPARDAPRSGARLPTGSEPSTLSELVDVFEMDAALQNPDADLPVSSLSMTEAGTILVPQRGVFSLTAWSKKQLASRYGLAWNTWFEGIDPRIRADEVNRRLVRDPGVVRVKTSSLPGDSASDGTLRAFVTPTYTTIPDVVVAQAILEELRAGDPQLIRHDVTDRTSSYVVQVGERLRFTGPAVVGDVRGGILVRNSDVGYASVLIRLHLTRVVCSNGMVVAEDETIFHRAHRRIELDVLREKLARGLQDLPSRLQRAGRELEDAGHHAVDHVEAALVEVLRLARLPIRLLPIMLGAYEREPHPSVFGVSQAITLGAQHARVSAEERLALEHAAGQYSRRFAAKMP